MFKKSIALMLNMALLLTISPLSAVYAKKPTAELALGTSRATADLVEVSDGIATDNFDFDYKSDLAPWFDGNSDDCKRTDSYPKTSPDILDNNGKQMTSDIFVAIPGDGSGFSFAKDSTGNQVLQVTNNASESGKGIYNRTRYFDFKPGQNIKLSYDVCFPSLPTDMVDSTGFLRFMKNYCGGIYAKASGGEIYLYAHGDESTVFKPVEKKWYRMIGEVDETGCLTTHLIDRETKEIMLTSEGAEPAFKDDKTQQDGWLLGADFSGGDINNKDKLKVWLDNAEFLFYTPAEYKPSMIEPEFNGEDNQPRNINLAFDFDLPLSLQTNSDNEITETGVAVQLKKVEDGTIVGTHAFLSETGDRITLSYDGLLERGKEYTVSFSGFKDNEKIDTDAIDEVSFTTEDLHPWNDVSIGNVAVNTTDNTKTDITFTLSDEFSYPVFSGGVLASLYRGGQMIGVEMLTLNNQNVASAFTKSFTLGTPPMAGDKVILMQVDTVGNILPLASGEFAIE